MMAIFKKILGVTISEESPKACYDLWRLFYDAGLRFAFSAEIVSLLSTPYSKASTVRCLR